MTYSDIFTLTKTNELLQIMKSRKSKHVPETCLTGMTKCACLQNHRILHPSARLVLSVFNSLWLLSFQPIVLVEWKKCSFPLFFPYISVLKSFLISTIFFYHIFQATKPVIIELSTKLIRKHKPEGSTKRDWAN